MIRFCIAAGLAFGVALGVLASPTGTVARAVMTDTNGVLTGSSTNFADANGLARRSGVVLSVFGRSSNVTAQAGDYTAGDVGAVPTGLTYSVNGYQWDMSTSAAVTLTAADVGADPAGSAESVSTALTAGATAGLTAVQPEDLNGYAQTGRTVTLNGIPGGIDTNPTFEVTVQNMVESGRAVLVADDAMSASNRWIDFFSFADDGKAGIRMTDGTEVNTNGTIMIYPRNLTVEGYGASIVFEEEIDGLLPRVGGFAAISARRGFVGEGGSLTNLNGAAIDFSLCPTSDVGLATGSVWVSDGFLKVVQ